jgi:NADPH:quinone reductase-like Zn-dependent oxidoreductase
MTTPTNKAAYLPSSASPTLSVREAPYTHSTANELLIRNAALAINPIDELLQQHGTAVMYNWLKYPAVLGHDLAGTVVEVGPNVTGFQVGDRVLAQAVGPDQKRNRPAEGAFQLYTIVSANAAAKIPEGMAFAEAAVVPLGLSTAATGLFGKGLLQLERPAVGEVKPTGKTVLIWGGSTSVGTNAIQLAVAAGYEVFTTCSPRNFELVKGLGAARAWDYNDAATVKAITRAFDGEGGSGGKRACAGALAIGKGGAEACMTILSALPSASTNRFVAAASFSLQPPAKYLATLRFVYNFFSWNAGMIWRGWRAGVKWKTYIGTALVTDDEELDLGKRIYEEWLPRSLKDGSFVPKPEVEVVGEGLESLQGAMDRLRKGLSAKKLVVRL